MNHSNIEKKVANGIRQIVLLAAAALPFSSAHAQLIQPEAIHFQSDEDALMTVDLAGRGRRFVALENPRQLNGLPGQIKIYKVAQPNSQGEYELESTITIPFQAQAPNIYMGIYYVSTTLFDNDPGIEYLLTDGAQKIQVIDESGQVLLSEGMPGASAVLQGGSGGGVSYEAIFPGANGRYRLRISIINGDGTYTVKFFTLPGKTMPVPF